MKQSLLKFPTSFFKFKRVIALWEHEEDKMMTDFDEEVQLLRKVQVVPPEHIIAQIITIIQNESTNFVQK